MLISLDIQALTSSEIQSLESESGKSMFPKLSIPTQGSHLKIHKKYSYKLKSHLE